MKKIILLGSALLVMVACKNTSEGAKTDELKIETPGDDVSVKDTLAVAETESVNQVAQSIAEPAETESVKPVEVKNEAKEDFVVFGDKFSADKALTSAEMLKKYKGMKTGDTLTVKFRSKINDVCKKKGCWMSMAMPNEKESFVRFKDYGFFVPKNADGSEAVVSGRAYIDVISVAQLQHYAKDGGKSQEEIDKITEPKITYAFQADGVLIKE